MYKGCLVRPSTKAWLGLGLYVVTADAMLPPGETMSERVDDWIEEHPIATIATVGAVTLHLLNVYEHYNLEKYDVINKLANMITKGTVWNENHQKN